MIAEIVGPSGRVHYRRPPGDPLIAEAERTPGYSVRMVERETHENACPHCHGERFLPGDARNGHEPYPCPTCKGAGWVLSVKEPGNV